jgi:hypothetical protein
MTADDASKAEEQSEREADIPFILLPFQSNLKTFFSNNLTASSVAWVAFGE